MFGTLVTSRLIPQKRMRVPAILAILIRKNHCQSKLENDTPGSLSNIIPPQPIMIMSELYIVIMFLIKYQILCKGFRNILFGK